MIYQRIFSLALATLLSACATVKDAGLDPAKPATGGPPAPSQVTPAEALAIARRFAEHPWQPFAKNIRHGKDAQGVLVHTPDAGFKDQLERPGWWIPGEVNHGVPYKWGGFDDPPSFDAAVTKGLAAGDVSSAEKRRLDQAGVSIESTGVDCSGFVSRCLKLPSVHDTTRLPSVCSVIAKPADLRPGDLLNIPRGHVLLCAGWVASDRKWIYYYETGGGPNYWKPGLKQAPLQALLALGYQPLRYRGMAADSRIDGKQVLARAVRSAVEVVEVPTVGEP